MLFLHLHYPLPNYIICEDKQIEQSSLSKQLLCLQLQYLKALGLAEKKTFSNFLSNDLSLTTYYGISLVIKSQRV